MRIQQYALFIIQLCTLLYVPCIATEYMPAYTQYSGFQTLSHVTTYRDGMPEFPQADLQDPLDPNYTDFYRHIAPTQITRILRWLKIMPQPTWSAYSCAATINAVNQRHNHDNIAQPVAHLQVHPEITQLFIWGDLHAAFHSLSRDLEDLHNRNIIDEQLELQSPNYYFIFNGNAIDLSPYSMETLTLIANLMLKNPGQIIYLAGDHERDNYWFNFSLKRQIDTYNTIYATPVAYTETINTFFSHLPHALYITKPDGVDALRIAPDGINESPIRVDQLGDLFEQTDYYNVYDAAQAEPTTRTVDTIAHIKSEPWLYSQQAHDGFGLLEQEKGATTWTVLSGPVQPYRTYYPFNYDAYVQLDIGKQIRSSIAHLYHRSLDSNDMSFTNAASYNIYTSVPEQYASDEQLTHDFAIGSSMGFELNRRVMSEKTQLGVGMHLNTVNHDGGIHNTTHVRMYMYNDDYQPKQALDNIQYMIKNGITTLIAPLGTPTLKSYIDRVRNNDLLVLFPITGSPDLRAPDLSGLIHMRSSYTDEVKALIRYMVDDYSVSSFAFFYQDDAYGLGALRAARDELKRLGVDNWKEVPYVSGGTDFTRQAQEIQEAAPQAIGFLSGPGPMIRLIRALGIPSLANKYLFAISPAITLESRRFLNLTGLSCIASSVTPNPEVSNLPIAQEYRAAMDATNKKYDKFSFETFIGANIFADAAEQVDGAVTRDKIKHIIESYNKYQFKGLTLTFDPQTRSIPLGVWIETPDSKVWLKKL